jgi:hypothetical protein
MTGFISDSILARELIRIGDDAIAREVDAALHAYYAAEDYVFHGPVARLAVPRSVCSVLMRWSQRPSLWSPSGRRSASGADSCRRRAESRLLRAIATERFGVRSPSAQARRAERGVHSVDPVSERVSPKRWNLSERPSGVGCVHQQVRCDGDVGVDRTGSSARRVRPTQVEQITRNLLRRLG